MGLARWGWGAPRVPGNMGTTSFEHIRCEFGVCHPAGPHSLTPCLRRRPRRSCAHSTGCACPSASRCPPERSWAAPRPGCHRTRMPSCEYPGSPRTPSLMVLKDPAALAAGHSSRNRAQHPRPQSIPIPTPSPKPGVRSSGSVFLGRAWPGRVLVGWAGPLRLSQRCSERRLLAARPK